MKTLIVAVVLLLGVANAKAQQVDSCLVLADEYLNRICPDNANHYAWQNPDTCMIDTCYQAIVSPCQEWAAYLYSKRGFLIKFDSDVFRLPVYLIDTNIAVKWTDLDTSYHFFRAVFDTLQQQWGNFVLIKHDPRSNEPGPACERIFHGF
jgi:hypothetical protein